MKKEHMVLARFVVIRGYPMPGQFLSTSQGLESDLIGAVYNSCCIAGLA